MSRFLQKSITLKSFAVAFNFVFLIGFLFLTVGCNSEDGKKTTKALTANAKKIGLALDDSSSGQGHQIAKAIGNHQKRNSTRYSIVEADGESLTAKIESLVSQEVDAILVLPGDGSSLDACKAAIEKGIKVVSFINNFDEDELKAAGVEIPFCGARQSTLATKLAEETLSEANENDLVAIFESNIDTNSAARLKSYTKVCESKKLKIVESKSIGNNKDKAEEHTAKAIAANPKLTAVFCGHENIVLGAIAAVKKSENKEVLVSGFGTESNLIKQRQSGEFFGIISPRSATEIAIYAIGLTLKAVSTDGTVEDDIVETPILRGLGDGGQSSQ